MRKLLMFTHERSITTLTIIQSFSFHLSTNKNKKLTTKYYVGKLRK